MTCFLFAGCGGTNCNFQWGLSVLGWKTSSVLYWAGLCVCVCLRACACARVHSCSANDNLYRFLIISNKIFVLILLTAKPS